MGRVNPTIANLAAAKRVGMLSELKLRNESQDEWSDASRQASAVSTAQEGAWRLDQLSPGS